MNLVLGHVVNVMPKNLLKISNSFNEIEPKIRNKQLLENLSFKTFIVLSVVSILNLKV